MDALLRINKHFGITVICNLHSLDLARSYCDRLIGMSAGRVVFDGAPATLTDQIARELYDLEANEVMGAAPARRPTMRPFRRSAPPPRPERLAYQGDRCRPAIGQRRNHNKRAHHDQPSHRSCRRRRAGVHGHRASAQDWKAQISGADLRRGAGRERLRRDRALARRSSPISPRSSASRSTLRVANDYAAVIEGQRAGNIQIASYGSASFARARLTGVKTDAFANDINSDGTTGYYSVFFVKADEPVQEASTS